MTLRAFAAILFCAAVAFSPDAWARSPYADGTDAEIIFPTVTLRVGEAGGEGEAGWDGWVGATLRVEVASTGAQRARGLSGRDSLDADSGMLFIFAEGSRPCFWMRNTSIPLELAYLEAGGRILQTLSLIPLDETPRCAEHLSRYGLELNPGWLEKSGVKVGDVIPGLPE